MNRKALMSFELGFYFMIVKIKIKYDGFSL